MKNLSPPLNIDCYHSTVVQSHVDVLYASSLTKKLRSLHGAFSVQLRFLGEARLDGLELCLFDDFVDEGVAVWCREVCLCLQDVPVVSARSVCLLKDVYWKDVLDCGTRPLGEILFGEEASEICRTPFKWSLFPVNHALVSPFASQALWGRSSVFKRQEQALLLTECFLPQLLDFL